MEMKDEKRNLKEKAEQEYKIKKIVVSENLWCNLPLDIYYLISSRLLSVDYSIFRGVCRTWRSVAPDTRPSTMRYTRYITDKSPLLLCFCAGKGSCTFFDPMYDISHNMDFPELCGARIHCSNDGWLLISSGNTCIFFFNPFTGERIGLPTLLEHCFPFISFGFRSKPTLYDCVVIGTCRYFLNSFNLLVWKHGDTEWKTYRSSYNCIPFRVANNCPVYCQGKFYILNEDGQLGVLAVNRDDYNLKVISHFATPCSPMHKKFLTESNGELVLVIFDPMGKNVHCLQLCHFKNNWVRVDCFNHQMLFLSHLTCLSTATTEKRIGNKIYLPKFQCISGKGKSIWKNVIYSLRTRKYHSFGSSMCRADWCETKEPLQCTWIQPPSCYR